MSHFPLTHTLAFVELLKKENELTIIDDEVNPNLELAEIQRREVEKKGKALLFTNVKGCEFSVATNLYGSQKRIDLAFGGKPEKIIAQAVELADRFFPPDFKKVWGARKLAWNFLKVGTKTKKQAPLLECEIAGADLTKLPQIVCWPEDGGAFITLPLVYTQSPSTGISNLGMYRIQLFEKNQCGMHFQIHRGSGYHYHEAQQLEQSLPVHIYVGGPPALTISAVAPLPENVPEILLASLMLGQRLGKVSDKHISPLPLLADADFCIVGEIPPHKRRLEGPFGDHYGYYSLQHDYPFVDVKKVYHRKNAIYPATIVGRPPQEDHYIAGYLQDLLTPIIRKVMPQVKQVWAYDESGIHSLAGAVVHNRYPREAFTCALRILGEGQLSLSKVLMVTDLDCDVRDFKKFFQIILERIDLARDLFILSNISQDTLDYTGPKVNEGSKAIFLGLGEKKRDLPREFSGQLPEGFSNPTVFCPGALCVQGPHFPSVGVRFIESESGIIPRDTGSMDRNTGSINQNTGSINQNTGSINRTPTELSQHPDLANWPMVFLVDDAKAAARSAEDFLWHIFTRFEPAADIYAKNIELKRFHASLTPPVVIDCRMKPWYPKVLQSDPDVVKRLSALLKKYNLD